MFGSGQVAIRLRATVTLDSRTQKPTGYDWDSPDRLEIPGVAFDPGGSFESVEAGRSAMDSQPTIYDPSYADVKSGDRVLIGSTTYEVDGEPAAWSSPFTGWNPGQVIKLKVREG